MSACRGCRDGTGDTRISQRRSVADGNDRGGAIAQTAGATPSDVTETQHAAIDEDRTSESVGAGKNQRAVTGLDEGQGCRISDASVNRHRARSILLENEVRRGAGRIIDQLPGGPIDIPVSRSVDEDGTWGRRRASAQLHVERRKIQGLGAGTRKFQGTDSRAPRVRRRPRSCREDVRRAYGSARGNQRR